MHKDTMMGLFMMAALGAVLLEVNASPDTDAIFLFTDRNKLIDNIGKLEEQCIKITGENKSEVMDRAKETFQSFTMCLYDLDLNRLQMQSDRNCTMATEVLKYFNEFTNRVQVCLTAEGKQTLQTQSRIMESIALFVDEMGSYPNVTKNAIDNCIYQSFPNHHPGNDYENPKFLKLFFLPTSCVYLQRFESCVLHLLESCPEVSPRIMVQSILKTLKNETDCQELNAINVTDSSGLISNNSLHLNGNATSEGPTNVTASSGLNANNTIVTPGNSTGGGAPNPSDDTAGGGTINVIDSSKPNANNTLTTTGNATSERPTNVADSSGSNVNNTMVIPGNSTGGETSSGNTPSQSGFPVAGWVGIGLLIGTFYNRHS
ncbi:uncharacterized protein [Drosophila bipectinata]|uniref:uncharacterized protein n=1 Tax=Drosophila bipectinata TaxID=42026 RepID=UPI001C8A33D5|nr:uncharacterized protein LOC122321008 [Drosophila bipectinata]